MYTFVCRPRSVCALRRPRLPRWLKLLSFSPAVSVLNEPLNEPEALLPVVVVVVLVDDELEPPPPPHAASPRTRTRSVATRPARRLTRPPYNDEGGARRPPREIV